MFNSLPFRGRLEVAQTTWLNWHHTQKSGTIMVIRLCTLCGETLNQWGRVGYSGMWKCQNDLSCIRLTLHRGEASRVTRVNR